MSNTLRYAFFPGCTLESAAAELKVSTERTCKKLGIELVEIEGWTCCGAAQVQDVDDFFALLVNARNLALAESQGFDKIMTVCNTCTLMLRTARAAWTTTRSSRPSATPHWPRSVSSTKAPPK